MKSINLQCKQVVLIALSISFIMRHLGGVKSSRTNLLAFAGLAAMLMTTACGNVPTGPNQAPVGYWLDDNELTIDAGQSVNLSMGSIFHDPDGDALTYTAESHNTATVTVSVSGGPANLVDGVNSVLGSRMESWLRTVGSTATLAGVNKGSTYVRVTATDPGGLSARVSISLTIVRFLGACSVGMVLGARDACSVGSDRFSVWRRGYAQFGCCILRTLGTRIQSGQFSASRIPRTDAWRIDSVP